MAETVLFAEQTVSDFAYSDTFSCFATLVSPAPFIPEQGRSYIVNWDGEEFQRTAFTFTAADGASCIGIGNTIMTGVDSGEPFLIVYDATNRYFYFFSTETDSSHTISVLLEEYGCAVILKDRDGNDVTYANANGDVPTIKLDTPDGGTQTYIKGEMKEATVALDFSEGDMEVVPEDGTLFSKVAIPVPKNLVPANIAEGVDIAGVAGTLKAGGDSELALSILAGTVTEINLPEAAIRSYGFYNNKTIKTARVKNAESYAFYGCSALASVELLDSTALGKYTFYNCAALQEVNAPKLGTVGSSCFYGCTSLRKIESAISMINENAFQNCSNLTEFVSTYTGAYVTVSRYSFLNCTSLKKIDLAAKLAPSRYDQFKGCAALETVIMRGISDDVSDLSYPKGDSSDAFEYSPNVYFYVPAAMKDIYLAKTNWATFAARFRTIEDYPDICG